MNGYHLTPVKPRGRRAESGGREASHEATNISPHKGPPSVMAQALEHHRAPRKLVLCFDGTGNKFRGDDSDSNILKIFRCLDREAGDQCRSRFTAPNYNVVVVLILLSRPLLPAGYWYVCCVDFAVAHEHGGADPVVVSEGEGFRDRV
jgi:hypothetical protein